ncbi:radical SAM protein, partial [bacterium]|nr:radical SAM protein [bacterium]
AVGKLAHQVRTRLHGRHTYFNQNRHINPTNVCAAHCNFCSFRRNGDEPDAYTWTPEQMVARVRPVATRDITEFHLVGGLHPELGLTYYEETLRALKAAYPWIHLKALTAVEIEYLCRMEGVDHATALQRLIAAGLGSLPGGGAEIFHPRVRRKICPEKSVHVPLAEVVAKAYALGSFPALWAVEGIGHDYVEARKHRGESLTDLLTSSEVADLPDGSLTMLHAGIGLGLAEIALDDLRPDAAPEKMDAALRQFLADCTSSSRKGYVGCALESLGLVTRHFYGHSMVLAVDKRLEGIDEAMRGFFWHGVGRAVYFSPDNMVPGLSSPWPAVDMCDRLAPHDLARDNMVAGVAWGMTMVNLKQPVVLEALLHKHAAFADSAAFSNGVASSIVMRKDTTPDEEHIAALVKYEPTTSDASLEALWDRAVRQPRRAGPARIWRRSWPG